jgi:hypothetical protein
MRFVNALLLPVLLASAMNAQEKDNQPVFFTNIDELKTWAQKSFGGSKVEILTHKGDQVVIVNRMLTSGIASSQISVFVKSANGWSRSIYLSQYSGDFIDSEQKGDLVTLRAKSTKNEILRFSIFGLNHQPIQ